MTPRPGPPLLDAVSAYNRLAPEYGRLATRRARYLEAVEDLIVSRIPPDSRSMLDIGAGDGLRAARIARRAGLADLVLLEPSTQMRSLQPPGLEAWPLRLEELDAGHPELAGRRFDVMTCLWNVLGHVKRATDRARGLAQLGSLLSPGGVLFVDVNHRYNTRAYGLLRTAARAAWDLLRPSETNGDVVVEWELGEGRCTTRGHVFTHSEMQALAQAAGLAVTQRLAVDYETGRPAPSTWQGNLLYVLQAQGARRRGCLRGHRASARDAGRRSHL